MRVPFVLNLLHRGIKQVNPARILQNPKTRLSTIRARRPTGTGMPTPLQTHVFARTPSTRLTSRHENPRNPWCITRIGANGSRNVQHQEAQDQPLSLTQWHRPEVQEESQACAARDDEGVGTCSRFSFVVHFSGAVQVDGVKVKSRARCLGETGSSSTFKRSRMGEWNDIAARNGRRARCRRQHLFL